MNVFMLLGKTGKPESGKQLLANAVAVFTDTCLAIERVVELAYPGNVCIAAGLGIACLLCTRKSSSRLYPQSSVVDAGGNITG